MVLLDILWYFPFFFVFATLVVVGWAPVLASERVRTLFGRWPTGILAFDYPLLTIGVLLASAVAFVAFGLLGGTGRWGLVGVHLFAPLVVGIVGWLGVVVVLPRVGVDVPSGTWLPLGVGALWFGVVVPVAGGVMALLVFLVGFPG